MSATPNPDSDTIILYDLPSRPRPHISCWSANVWKTRLYLNYKRIPYRTEWIPLHALQTTLATKADLSPNPKPNWSDYTVPTIRLPSGSHIMDSAKIAASLETLYPEPKLSFDVALETEAQTALMAAFLPFIPEYFMPKLVDDVIALEDVEWFHADRAAKFGKPLDEMKGPEADRSAVEKAQAGLDQIVALLRKYQQKHEREGPFLMGEKVSYGDFILVSGLHCFMVLGRAEWEEVVGTRKELRALYEACAEWLKKDD